MNNLENKNWLTLLECAEYLGTTPKGIYARVHRKQIPYSKLGRKLLFEKNEIDKMLRSTMCI